MNQQIKFFDKSKCDFGDELVTTLASQGDATSARVLDRSNNTAWLTTGSVDADTTTLVIDFVDLHLIDTIILVKMNFASYKVEYWDGVTYQAFPTAIDVTGNTVDTKSHSFTALETTKIKLTVRGTIVADSDKTLCQVIATKLIGQFAGWPVVDSPILSRNKRISKMLSGKVNIADNLGGFSMKLKFKPTNTAADLALIQSLFYRSEGFLVWPCGGDVDQFTLGAYQGYRLEDVFLVRCQNDWNPELLNGILHVMTPELQLVEVTD